MTGKRPSQPAYQHIARDLEAKIVDGSIHTGDFLPPERELAKQYGVSRMTVRQALDQLDQKGFLSRTPGQGTMVVRAQSNLPKGALVGFLMPFVTSPRDRVLFEAESVLYKGDCEVALANTLEDVEIEERRIKDFERRNVVGLIVIPCTPYSNLPYLERLGRDLPVVIAQRPLETELDLIATDELTGAFKATNLLIEKGKRRIAYIHSQRTPLSDVRLNGYEKAIRGSGLEPNVLAIEPGASMLSDIYRVVSRLMQSDQPVDGFFAYNDLCASAVLYALKDLGIAVGRDVMVVGYDNSEIAQVADPPLSSVDRRVGQVGEAAAKRLLERIAAGNRLPRKSIWIGADLIERASTGSPASQEASRQAERG